MQVVVPDVPVDRRASEAKMMTCTLDALNSLQLLYTVFTYNVLVVCIDMKRSNIKALSDALLHIIQS